MDQLGESKAVVMGGSVAGLLAAAALAECFDRVLVVESHVEARVPQSGHVHGLLSSGWAAMCRLLPKLELRLKAAGVDWVHYGQEFRWNHFGEDKARFEDEMRGPFSSRATLQKAIQEEALTVPNIELIEAKVSGLIGTLGFLEGVMLDDGSEVRADVVVDATGRVSSGQKLLSTLGFAGVPERRYPVDLRYCSLRMRVPQSAGRSWKSLFVVPEPPKTEAGAIFPLEDGSNLVTLSGRAGDRMPASIDEFYQFAERVADPEFVACVSSAEAVGEMKHYRFREALWRDYANAKVPKNFYVLGDALCSLNPLFGQGMTLCALQAVALREHFQKKKTQGSSRYFKSVSRLVGQAWQMTMLEDMRYPEWDEKRGVLAHLMQCYTRRVYQVSCRDPKLNHHLYQVIHLQRPASDLFRPWVLWSLVLGR